MPFDLGMLGSMMRSPTANAPSTQGANPNALGEYGELKKGLAYLKLEQQRDDRLQQEHAFARMAEEKKTRQASIDAWLGAVRSGNRADIWVLGKRLKGMGVNVQMPDAFSASGIPSDTEASSSAPGEDELGFTLEERSKDEKLGKEITARGQKIVSELQGAAQGGTPEPFRPTRPDGTPIAEGIAQGALRGIQPVDFGAPTISTPFGPGGPTAIKPPASTWRVSDPVTGTDLEISPEQILADQEREIDQAFLPLVQMPDLDPIAARGYQIGYEYAKGQLGFKTPKEATDAGMLAANKYMDHMYKTGILGTRKARGGGGGGGPAVAGGKKAIPGFGGTELSEAELGVGGKVEDEVRLTVNAFTGRENYKKVSDALQQTNSAAARLTSGTSLGDRSAFRQFMTSVEQGRLSDQDAKWYQASGGIVAQIENIYNQVGEGGKLSDIQKREMSGLLNQLRKLMSARLNEIRSEGASAVDAVVDTYRFKDPARADQYRQSGRRQLGIASSGKGGGSNASTQKAKGLL